MKLYTPFYDQKRDRVTGIVFVPNALEGHDTPVAAADVDDPVAIESLIRRGFLPWPGEELPETSAPDAEGGDPDDELEGQQDAKLEGQTVQDVPPRSDPPPTEEELEALTAEELRNVAESRGVDVPSKATKADLRELITSSS